MTIIYLVYSMKRKSLKCVIEKSIFSYLDFIIPELQKHLCTLSRPMRVRKSNAVKSLSLIIRNDKDKDHCNSTDFKKTTTSHQLEEYNFSNPTIIKSPCEIYDQEPYNEMIHKNISPLNIGSSKMENPSVLSRNRSSNLSPFIPLKPRVEKEGMEISTEEQFYRKNSFSKEFLIDLTEKDKKHQKRNSKISLENNNPLLNTKPLSRNNSNTLQMIMVKSEKSIKSQKNNQVDQGNNFDVYYEPKYICNCYECCFECCPSKFLTYAVNPFKDFFQRHISRLRIFLLKNCKVFCYFMVSVSPFLDFSIINVISVMISGCVQDNTGVFFNLFYVIYSFLEAVFASFFFFACIFISSFVSTKRELMEIHSNDKVSRGCLVFYHVKKAFIFSMFHFGLQLTLKAIFLFNHSFFSTTLGNDAIIFCLVKNTFYFCFIISKYPNFRNVNLIMYDDHVLKSQFKYFNIQNLLIKYLPKADFLYETLKENYDTERNAMESIKDHSKNIKNLLEAKLEDAKENLKEELKIIENQKFQVILRNRGVSPIIPIALMWYIMIDSFASMVIAIIFLMKLNMSECIGDDVFKFASYGAIGLNIIEFIVLPFLIRITLETKTFFENEEN